MCQVDFTLFWLSRFQLVEHSVPRFSSFADKEAQAALIYLTFKRPRRKLSTAAQYQARPTSC